jgi:dienelactone hydrolase
MLRTLSLLSLVACLGLVASVVFAEEEAPAADGAPAGKTVDYTHGDLALQGWLQAPAPAAGKRPGVLIVHAWRGHGAFVRQVAADMAKKGYVAFALDMYGKGVYAKDNSEAATLAGAFYADPALMRARVRAGLDQLLAQPGVDASRIAAIGFCFGGTAVLELARDGADVAGVVSFHGGLKTKAPATDGVKAKILICHGADEVYVPKTELVACWEELQKAGADYQILMLGNAVHSFTDPEAGDDPSRGVAYSASAATRAWKATDRFFAEIFEASR